jgi:hypothetical protein
MELGLYTFAELNPDPATGRADAGRRLREVVEEILFQDELFGHDRFLAQMSVGTLPHPQAMRAIELLGTGRADRSRGARAPRTRS